MGWDGMGWNSPWGAGLGWVGLVDVRYKRQICLDAERV